MRSYFCVLGLYIGLTVNAQPLRVPDSDPVAASADALESLAQPVDIRRPKSLGVFTDGHGQKGCSTEEGYIGRLTVDMKSLWNSENSVATGREAPATAVSAKPPLSALQNDLVMPLGKQVIRLRLLEQLRDAEDGLLHVSGLTLEGPKGVARFTTDSQHRLMVGTVTIQNSIFRLIPTDNFYELYKLPPSRRYERVSLSCATAGGAPKLETTHVKMLVLADIQPTRVRLEKHEHTLLLQGDALGTMASGSGLDELLAALKNLGPLVPDLDSQSLRVTEVFGSDQLRNQARSIRFEQVFDGIPLDRRNDVRVDEDGNIIEFNLSLVPAEIERKVITIHSADAVDRAKARMQLETGDSQRDAKVVMSELKYIFSDGSLIPEYRVTVRASDGNDYFVRIRGDSGAADVVRASIR